MKYKSRVFLIIIAIFTLWSAMIITDFFRIHKNIPPLFSVSFADYSISKSYIKYLGLFYKVERYPIDDGTNFSRKYLMSPWFYNTNKDSPAK